LAFLIMGLMYSCNETTEIPEAGVSKKLADHRKSAINDLHYDLSFKIPSKLSTPIEAEEVVSFHLKEPLRHLVLDFDAPENHLKGVSIDGKPVPYDFINEHIMITGEHVQVGRNKVKLSFTAGELSLNRNEDYLYTLFVPERASTAFPCFDQPDMKASFQLNLTIPKAWRAVTNGALKSRQDTADHAMLSFRETKPISTYLFAFVAGDFEKISRTRNGTTINMFHKESDTTKVEKNLDKMFDLHFSALKWLEDYTRIQYPFGKFDFILIPSFQYSGMEHPGATYYRDSRVLLDETATIRDELNRANLISHETAHMWFGDLVTMKWFDEVWLKEVFANFMADKITQPQYPDINHRLNFLLNHYPSSYSVDRTRGANPVNQQLNNLNQAGTLYGAIIYHKAPIVMRNLENITGKQTLQRGLQQYLSGNRYGNATWNDLIRILDQGTDNNLTAWSNIWVNEPGMPRITVDQHKKNGFPDYLTLKQEDPREQERLWKQQLNIELGSESETQEKKIFLDQRSKKVSGIAFNSAPQYILPNAGGKGYGYFEMNQGDVEYLLGHISAFKDELKRAVIWINLWENLLHHTITPVEFHKAVIEHLPRETNAQCINLITDYLGTNFWRFLTSKQRESHSRETESLIWSLMKTSERKDIKSTYFKTYRSIAYSRAAIDKLHRTWNKQLKISGLSFSQEDYIRMSYELLLKNPEKADTVKARQLERIEGDEKKREFRFIQQALAEDKQERDRFFQSLLEPKNREKEPWVSRALHYLHHPLRAGQSVEYIRPALEELQEIQRTGDIFFPKSWLDATLWGHSSGEAASTVRSFLEDHPRYPENLKNKILQSSDMLFRAVGVNHD